MQPYTLHIRLEDRLQPMPAGSTLADLIERLGHAPQAITTAVDGLHVPRTQRATHALRDGQCVLLFKPIVGG